MYLSTQMTKYPYFPAVPLEQTITKFGSVCVNYPEIYLTHTGTIIVETDCLVGIKDIFKKSLSRSRKRVYTMVSGDCTQEEFTLLLKSFYKHEKSFTTYTDETIFLQPDNLTTALIKPLRERIDEYMLKAHRYYTDKGGKFLIITHDKLLFSFRHTNFELMEGSTIQK